MKTYTKTEDGRLQISEEKSEVVETTFTYDYLIKQREAIEAHKARDIEARDAELAEIDELIAEAKKLKLDDVVKDVIEENDK